MLLSASGVLLYRLATSISFVTIIISIGVCIWALWDNMRIWWRYITTYSSNRSRVLFFGIICICNRWRIDSIWNFPYLFFFCLNSIWHELLFWIFFPILDFDFLFWKRRIVTYNFRLLLYISFVSVRHVIFVLYISRLVTWDIYFLSRVHLLYIIAILLNESSLLVYMLLVITGRFRLLFWPFTRNNVN